MTIHSKTFLPRDVGPLGYEPAEDMALDACGLWLSLGRRMGRSIEVQVSRVGDLVRFVVISEYVSVARAMPPLAAFLAVARAIEFAVFAEPSAGTLRNRNLFPEPDPVVELAA